jgi:hypothetical protein
MVKLRGNQGLVADLRVVTEMEKEFQDAPLLPDGIKDKVDLGEIRATESAELSVLAN